uniref:Leucine zipper transcription factor-like protein 1 n=1 Tax=Pristionchus pacificus TaxID=54126 RepID=A0A8R1U928_PRIPA
MEEELAVNSSHAFSLCQYLSYSRGERASRVETVKDVITQQIKKVKEAHYTKDEVKRMLETTSKLVEIDMNNELINISHNTFLLLRQLMKQAEEANATLKMNLSEIQNIELLKAVAQFEKEIHDKKAERTATILKDPSLLDESIKNLSSDFVSEFYRNDLINLSHALQKSSLEHNTSVNALKQRMLSTEEQLANETKFRSQEHKRISDMEKAHLEMEKRMRDISDQLALKEAELEKKFQSTNTYLNMQKILQSKNAIIQRMRAGNANDDDIEPSD